MYCKYCGSQIADDSVFCSRCGKLVVEATKSHDETSVSSQAFETQWWATDNLQWKKPITARRVQIGVLIILGLLSLYPLWCILSGGKVTRYYYGSGYVNELEREIHVHDPWKLKILKFTSVDERGYIGAEIEAKNVFRWRMFLVLLPFIALMWLVRKWMKSTRYPNQNDIVPRDVADEIEQYEWDGLSKYKYVFFKKDGKYGIIDARNYCVIVPAQYDSIKWRMPNKTFDVTLGEEKQTISIEIANQCNTNSETNELNKGENTQTE